MRRECPRGTILIFPIAAFLWGVLAAVAGLGIWGVAAAVFLFAPVSVVLLLLICGPESLGTKNNSRLSALKAPPQSRSR